MKLFISDYDMTIYINEYIDKKVIDAINIWRNSGNIFVVATGRNRFSILNQLDRFDICFDYLITNNGAVVVDSDRNVLYKKIMNESYIFPIVDFIHNNYDGSIEITTIDNIYSIRSKNDNSYRDKFTPIYIEDVNSLKNVIQINKITNNDNSLTIPLANILNEKFGENVIAYPNIQTIDIVPINTNKVMGIEYLENLLEKENKVIDKIIVAGDSYNDIEMITKYNGYVQELADDEVKKVSSKSFKLISDIIDENLYV